MTTKKRNMNARLEPLSSEQYQALNAWERQNDPAICPCCSGATIQAWLDDQGCCPGCFSGSAAVVAREATLSFRNGRIFMKGILS